MNDQVDIAVLKVHIDNLRRECERRDQQLSRRMDEADKRIEATLAKHDMTLDSIRNGIAELDTKSKNMRFGFVVVAGIGGLAAWLVDVAGKVAGLVK